MNATVARRTSCDRQLWEQLLADPGLSDIDFTWMLDQGAGWPDYDFRDRGALVHDLLTRCARPLNAAHLRRLTTGEILPSPATADLLLAHPAANTSVACALAHSVSASWGGPAFAGRQRWEQILERRCAEIQHHLRCCDDIRISTIFRLRRFGVSHWHPNWDEVSGLMAGVTQAQRLFDQAMETIDRHGPRGWSLARTLAEESHLRGPDLMIGFAALTG